MQRHRRIIGIGLGLLVASGLPIKSMAMTPPRAIAQPNIAQSSTAQNQNPQRRSVRIACPSEIQTLIPLLLRDLPAYANRTSQRVVRQVRAPQLLSYLLLVGQPEFEPLTLGPGPYRSAQPPEASEDLHQVFVTTLERQYVSGEAIELQHYHWLFLTKTVSGWRLAMMFSRLGGYPEKQPPSPPRDTSDGVIAQAIETWLRDCRAGSIRS